MDSGVVPGLALALTKDSEILYLKGYGTAQHAAPVTPQTQFLIASLSKSFTALAILQLAEQGLIALDASVQEYLPDFRVADPTVSSRITIRELLNQTSGMADKGFPEGLLPQPGSIRERVASLRSARLVATPGTEFHYFNPNYAVLARVVESVTGQKFESYLRMHVFEPLGMTNTFSAVTSAEAMARTSNLAEGHLVAFGFAFPCAEMSGYLGGSGGVVSTAEDLAHYLVFQSGNGVYQGTKVLSAESLKLMHTPPPHIPGGYAMGWFAAVENGRRAIEHNGILSAYYAEAVMLPESGWGLVLLYNVESVPSTLLAFPRIKSGILGLLTHSPPAARSVPTVRTWGVILAALTVFTTALGLRSFLRRFQWRERARRRARWRSIPHFLWWLLPAILLAALPWIVLAATGRSFGYTELFRSLPDLTVWLVIGALLGLLNAFSRAALLVRAPTGPQPTAYKNLNGGNQP